MPDNTELAHLLAEIADILDIADANPFRIRAYRNAARTIENTGDSFVEMARNDPDRLAHIPGIGKGMQEKIHEYATTGVIDEHRELCETYPQGLRDMLKLPSFGPKSVKRVYQEKGISSIEELQKAAENGELRTLAGFGEKTEAKILRSIQTFRTLQTDRIPWHNAAQIIEPYLAYLRQNTDALRLETAGSYRRCRDSVGDIDILAATEGEGRALVDIFTRYEHVKEILAAGDTKGSVILHTHDTTIQVDLRVVAPDAFGAALQYFTGSKEHNVTLRGRAKERGLKISEYGVFDNEEKCAGKTEEDVYAAVGCCWIAPELRENRGEIDAAAENRLPTLVTADDIRGDMHTHTTYTDGVLSVRELIETAQKRGYQYIAITDHSQAVRIANGLTPERLRTQIEEIHTVRAEYNDIDVFAGCEVDIMKDGSLDIDDDTLGALDFVIASVHFSLDMPKDAMTQRILAAIHHPAVNCIGHPTGQLRGERLPYDVDMDAIITAAAEQRVALEINSSPHRLDLNENYAYQARQAGVTLCITTDAHRPEHFDFIALGVSVARRAWCENKDILNTWSADTIRAWCTH